VLIAQHHAERPWTGLWRHLQNRFTGSLDGAIFASAELGHSWQEQGNLQRRVRIAQVMEGSNYFRRLDRTEAQARTGLRGDPVLLWVGRLIPLKDPLTVLEGFSELRRTHPGARLYLIYTDADLKPPVEEYLRGSAGLKQAVELVGRVPHAELEAYYNSADLFVLGSHYEGSGYSLCEALACGLIPVVTDIPSFRAMIGGGGFGGLWKPGSADQFAEVCRDVLSRPQAPQAAAARRQFEDELSYPAIARQALAFYSELLAERSSRLKRAKIR
jgi:glycosyltransferase involved in cell wall biosynthesis